MLVRKEFELLESPADVVELFVVIADILPGDSIWKVVAPALDKDVSLVVVNLLFEGGSTNPFDRYECK